MNLDTIRIKKHKFDKGFHIQENLIDGRVKRLYCSLNNKCMGRDGKKNWCKNGKIYLKGNKNPVKEYDIREAIENGIISKEQFDSIRLLYL